MKVRRLLRHFVAPRWWAMRPFPKKTLAAIEHAIAASEASHRGELRFAVEGALPIGDLVHGKSPRRRALDLFSQLRVWDTADNSGVLIYLQLVDRRVEIVADRGIDAKVGQEFWNAVCRRMEQAFRAGDFEGGALAALGEITAELARHFPSAGNNPNELPDAPVVL